LDLTLQTVRKSLIRGFFLCQTLSLLNAQVSLTPDQAVKEALLNHNVLAAASAKVSAAEGARLQAGLKPNPRLFLQTENTRFYGTPGFRYWHETDNFAYLSQVIESGGKRKRRIEAAGENIVGNELTLEALRTQVASRVLSAYWAAVGADRLAQSFKEGLGNLERAVEFHRVRVQEGALPEADLIRIELEHRQVSISYQNALQDARRLKFQLFREMGVQEQLNTTLTARLDEIPVSPPQDASEIDRRPDVRLSSQAIRQANSLTNLQRANAVPDPEVLFGYKRSTGFNTLIAGVQINLPFRNRNQGAIAAAVAEEAAAAASLRAVKQSAATEISSLRSEFQQKKDLVEQMLPELRQQAAETSRIAQAVYREGASDILRLLDAERTRLQAEALYIRSLLEYHQADISLRTALGLIP